VGIRVALRKLIGKDVNGDYGTRNFGCKNLREKVWESNISFNKKYYEMNGKFSMCKVSVDTHTVSVD
jgi:hypothetical protein